MRDVTFEFGDFNVLVGPNDSGKTAVLDALVGTALRDSASWWQGQAPTVTGHGHLGAALKYALRPGAMKQAYPAASSTGVPPLDETGANLAAVVDALLSNDRDRFDQVEGEFSRLAPLVRRIAPSPRAGRRQLAFRLTYREDLLNAPGASDGLVLLLAFVVLAHHPEPPGAILVEQPEDGVHHDRLGDIVGFLRGMSEGRFGRKVPVVMTTHSPYLLDLLRPEEVHFLLRNDKGETEAHRFDSIPMIRERMESFHLGEFWTFKGEEGLKALLEVDPAKAS